MDDLMPDVDGAIAMRQRALNDIDGTHDTCAKTPGLRQNDLHAETPVFCQRAIVFACQGLDGSAAGYWTMFDPLTFAVASLRANSAPDSKANVAAAIQAV
jgi:hypothetical protein